MNRMLRLDQQQQKKPSQEHWEKAVVCSLANSSSNKLDLDPCTPTQATNPFSLSSFSQAAKMTTACHSTANSKRQDIGILAMEIQFPHQFVEQRELELHDAVSQGKYTVGLGQQRMAVPTEADDVASLCLSAVQRLLTNYAIDPRLIGRLEVGTESLLDKSKSIKSILMQLFEPCGNTEVLGVDNINACYGGTAALLNSICWLESSLWDGRLAIVVAGDIAVYAEGSARPTGGAGAVAILLGPNAPIVFEPGLVATHMQHVWDFYKPDLASEYPVVEGKYSIECYLDSLSKTFRKYSSRLASLSTADCDFGQEIDFFALHCPYVKLAQKGAIKLFGMISSGNGLEARVSSAAQSELFPPSPVPTESEKEFFACKVAPGLTCASQIGNMYCASVYASILSLLTAIVQSSEGGGFEGKRIGVFSYGSGLASSFFSFRIVSELGVRLIARTVNLDQRLRNRTAISPTSFESILHQREHIYQGRNIEIPSPLQEQSAAQDNCNYYLASIDHKGKRTYKKHCK